MLLSLKIVCFFAILSASVSIWCAESKSIVISQANREEALQIREHAQKHIETHKAEAGRKAFEVKEIVQNVINEARANKNTSPCLSGASKQTTGCAIIKSNVHDHSFKTSSVNASTQIVVFVSFSMPEESLKTLFKEAENNARVRLVLRGFIDDSMEKTAQKIKELDGIVDVDPEMFERYHIEQVPTFMWIKNDQALGKISGNVTLVYANEIFNEKIEKEGSIA